MTTSPGRSPVHRERHLFDRVAWLRAAVLGANDGIVSTGSLLAGVGAAFGDRQAILIAGLAGLCAGAMSMAAGEYVSVSSQSDAEGADLKREARELREDPEFERRELAGIYETRGLEPALALKVADQLMAHDALGAHARDELGIAEVTRARPLQAALASAVSFAVGAAMPLVAAALAPSGAIVAVVVSASLAALALLGVLGASAGGASAWRSVGRILLWGALAMAVTTLVGRLFGAGF